MKWTQKEISGNMFLTGKKNNHIAIISNPEYHEYGFKIITPDRDEEGFKKEYNDNRIFTTSTEAKEQAELWIDNNCVNR